MAQPTSLRKLTFLQRYVGITVGIVLMVSGLYYFIMPAGLVIGGVSGVGVLVNALTGVRVSYVTGGLNVLMLVLCFFLLGRKAFTRSVYGSLLFPGVLFLLEEFSPQLRMEDDLLLYAVFGGVVLGLGFGTVIRYGGTSGGGDIPIKIIHRYTRLPLSVALYLVDGAIILSGVVAFYADTGITMGLYALIAMAVSGRLADFVVLGKQSLKAVHIVTDRPAEMKRLIYDALERGVSLVPTQGGFTLQEKTMVVSVITREEYYKIRNIIADVDPAAFVFASPASEIQGDFSIRWEDE